MATPTFPLTFPIRWTANSLPAPYSVEGTIKTAGTIRTDLTVYLENRTHGGVSYAYTDAEGHYLYDDIQDSDLNAEPGDTIRVYTSDSDETYVEFIVADAPEEKVVDMDYILHPRPIAPYSIEGRVTYYKVPQNNLTVTIRNVSKDTSATCTTDYLGQYFYDNIRDSVLQAREGDMIHVSIPSGAGSTFTALETEEKVIDFLDIVMWGALWMVRITPKAGSTYPDDGVGSYTFQSNDGILSTISFTEQAEGMASFDIALINDNGYYNTIFAVGNLVEIWMDSDIGIVGSTKRLFGTIKNIKHDVNGGDGAGEPALNRLVLQGFDYIGVFKNRLVNELYRGKMTYEAIIHDLLAKYAPEISDIGVQTTGKSIKSSETIMFSHVDLFECLMRLREDVGDWVFYITPDAILKFEPMGYEDNDIGRELVEYDNPGFEFDDTTMANSVTVYGGQVSNLQSNSGWIGTASNNGSNAWRAFNNEF